MGTELNGWRANSAAAAAESILRLYLNKEVDDGMYI